MKNRLIDHLEGETQLLDFGPVMHCSFIGAAIAIGGAVFGAVQSKKAAAKQAKAANRATGAQEAADQRQAAIAENQDRRSQIVFDQYQSEFLPRQRELLNSAFNDDRTSPDAAEARAMADVRKAGANAQEINDRAAMRLGVDPSSGAFAQGRQDIQVRNAATEASERGFARREARDSNFARQNQVLGMGSGLAGTAGSLSGSAAGINGGLAASAQRRREIADQQSAEAGRAFGNSVATGIGGLYDAWRNRPASSMRVDSPVTGGGGYNPMNGGGVLYG